MPALCRIPQSPSPPPSDSYLIKHIHGICSLPGLTIYGNYMRLSSCAVSFFVFRPQLPANRAAHNFTRIGRIIPLVIIAFRKKDGGLSGCSKKSVPKSERFFDNRYKLVSEKIFTMKQYVIDELRADDHFKIRKYLDETYGPAALDQIYWVPLAAEVLTEIQIEHSSCQPFYFAIEAAQDRLSIEMLVRTKNRIRCACIGYATEKQRTWIMNVADAIFEKLDIVT
jgi:hypothetical protein